MNRLIRTPVNTDTYCGPFKVRINEVWLEIKHEKVQARSNVSSGRSQLLKYSYTYWGMFTLAPEDRLGKREEVWRHGPMVAKVMDLNKLCWKRRPLQRCMGYRFGPESYHLHRKDIHVKFFAFFGHFCRTTVCWDRKILLPCQRDVTNSPLYRSHSLE